MKHFGLWLLVIGSVLRLGAAQRAEGDAEIGLEATLQELTQALGSASRVEVYEGLPNPFGEAALFKEQKLAKTCRQIGGEWFYAAPQEAKLGDALELQRLVEARLFQPWRGLKLCGGFHADYAIAAVMGKRTVYVLFCFGCHEARIISEAQPFAADLHTVDFRLTTDLKPELFDAWRARLTAYRKERPVRPTFSSGR